MKFNKKSFWKSLYKISTVLFLVGYNFAPSFLAIDQLKGMVGEITPVAAADGPYTISSTSGKWTAVDGGGHVSGIGTSTVKWGTCYSWGYPYPCDKQSGLGFQGTGSQTFSANQKFLIGDLTHMNWPISNGANGATLEVTLNFSNPQISSPKFSYDFDIEETSNKDELRDCKYYGTDNQVSTTPCDDIITFPNAYGDKVFEIDDTKYTLKIDGFQKAFPEGDSINKFVTEEKKDNKAYLVGHLSSILVEKPAISIVKKVNGDDANTATGPLVAIGDTVNFEYIVQNTGNVTLSGITVTDNKGVNVTCPETELNPGVSMTCTGSAIAIEGQYTNIGTVNTTSHPDVTASDPANYYGVKKIDICHATKSGEVNPYNNAQASMTGDVQGHDSHHGNVPPRVWYPGIEGTWDDIIPPFSYPGGSYPGKNWDAYGQSVYNNNCTIPTGTLKVKKVTVPAGDNTEFAITGSGESAVTGAPTFMNGNTGTISSTSSHTFTVYPGTYSVAETKTDGWKEVSNTCKDIVVANGKNEECTITNTKYSSLTIIKNATPRSEEEFSFTTTGEGLENFKLVDNSDTSNPSKVFENLLPGNYSVNEIIPEQWNWYLDKVECTDGKNHEALTLSAGENITCTFNNVEYGSISGHKYHDLDGLASTTNDRKPVYGYTIFIDTNKDGILDPGEKSTTTAIDGSYSFTGLEPGEYTIAEVMKIGWIVLPSTVTSWTIELSAGEDKKNVDFINIEKPTIEVIKFVDIDGDGEVDERYVTDWTWKLDDKENKMFGKEEKPMEIMPGTYTISEIQKDGYHVKSMMCDNGGVKIFEKPIESAKLTINSGDKILCRFTNTRDTGTLIVRKKVINDNGGKLEAREFSFKIGTSKGVGFDQDPTNPLLGENRFEKYPTGTYSIIEPEANTRGYTTTYDNCDKIVVEKGKEAVCTITNDDVAPTLTVIKKVVNDNGGTATANDFGIKLNGDELKFKTWPGEVGKYTSTYFATPEVKSNTKYELEEIDHPGYKEGKWSCTDDKTGKIIGGYQFSLTEGQKVTCAITNDDIAPSLELVKEVDNKYGGSAQITDWTLTATGPTTISGDSGVKSKDNFKAGTYTLSETAKEGISGYEAGDWDCTNDIIVNDNNQITLEVGQTTVCTIKNTEIQPTLTLVKTVENNHGGLKQVADFKLYIGDTEVTSGKAHEVNSGVEYTVREDQLPGYTASTWSGDCSADGKITLSSGENKTCTITNSDSQSKITVIKKVINDHGGTATVDDFDITLTNSTLEFDAGVEEGDTTTYTATVFGDVNKEYTLSETVAGTGYHMESLECSLGSNGVFTLPEGEDVTCTIVNNDIQPTLTVKKVVDNGTYGDKQVSDFTLYVSGNKVTNGEVNKFNAGDYTVSEDNIDGYVATFSGDCDLDGDVTLNVGDNKVCTITNRSTHGKIIIKKLVEPRGDKTKFTFTGDLTGTIGNNGTIEKVVIPGDYSVTEQSVKGWNLKSLVCDDTDSVKDGYTANIKVGDNETVTCTFTNEKLGSISGFKYEDRNGNGKWDVLPLFSELPLRGWTIFIDKNDNGVLDIGERFTKTNILGYYEFNNLPVGETYIIREVQKDGWTQTSANPAPITIAAGDVRIFVNFGNFKDATINVTKDVVGVDGKTNVVDTHEFTALLNNNEDTGKTIAEGTIATYKVVNGKHTISEVEDENYTTLGCFIGKKEFTNYSVRSGETYNVVCKNAQKPATINVTKNVVDVNGEDVVDTTHFKSILTDEDGNQVAEEQKIGEALPPATYTINTMGLYTISEPYSQFFENLGCTILLEGNEVPFTNYSVRSGGKYDVVCTNKQKTATIEVTKDVVGINGEEVKDPTEFTSILSDSDGNQIGEGQIAEGTKVEYKINEMGRYTVSELSDEDYENLGCTVLQSNGEEVLFENYRVRSGGRYRVTCKNAQLPATLIVTKDVVNSEGEDVDGDIFSDDQFDVVLGAETKQIADTANGKQPAIFEGLQPGVHTFTETPKEGYIFEGCTDDGEVTLGSNQTLEVVCTNKVIDPILKIEKSNDAVSSLLAGDMVTYTITVTAPIDDIEEGTYVLNNVVVSDIAPAGFKYILGSWTVEKNSVDITDEVPEPTYNDTNVAQWMIGDMKEGDVVVLTYRTRISLLQDPGNYPDIAWVAGTSLIDGAVLGASTVDPLTPFVGTDVTVIEPDIVEEGEVLGASITLPDTGASTYLTLGALIMMILGVIALLFKPFKKLNYALLTGLMAVSFVTLLTPNRVLAEDSDIKVRIMQPATPTNKSSFNVGFVALDLKNNPITVECYKDAVLFETLPNVNTGNCPAKVDASGTYTFYVIAKSTSGEQKSADVTVVVDLEKPSPVIDYSKAGNVLKFKTANDGKTKKVEIHRSTTPKYTANESTRIHTMDVLPNTEYSWTDTTAETGKTYYYALRTVDAVGNVSTIVSDPEVKIVPPTTTGTGTTATVTTPTEGEVAGQTDTKKEGEVAGEADDLVEGEEKDVEKKEETKEDTKADLKETGKKILNKWYIWVVAILVLGGVAFYVKKQKSN